jgi:hypothetical protein
MALPPAQEDKQPAQTSADKKPEPVGHPPDWLILPTTPDEEPPRKYNGNGSAAQRTILASMYT